MKQGDISCGYFLRDRPFAVEPGHRQPHCMGVKRVLEGGAPCRLTRKWKVMPGSVLSSPA